MVNIAWTVLRHAISPKQNGKLRHHYPGVQQFTYSLSFRHGTCKLPQPLTQSPKVQGERQVHNTISCSTHVYRVIRYVHAEP